MNIFQILALAFAGGYCLFLIIYFIVKAIRNSEMAVKRYLEKFKRTTLSSEAITEMDDEEFEDIMKDLYDLQYEYTEADNPIFDEVFGNLNQYIKLRKILKAEAEKEAKEIFQKKESPLVFQAEIKYRHIARVLKVLHRFGFIAIVISYDSDSKLFTIQYQPENEVKTVEEDKEDDTL